MWNETNDILLESEDSILANNVVFFSHRDKVSLPGDNNVYMWNEIKAMYGQCDP